MNSVIIYNWPTGLDVELLRRVKKEMMVRMAGDTVTIEPRMQPNATAEAHSTPTEGLRIDKPDLITLHSLCVLLSKKIMVGPVYLVSASPEDLREVSGRYDVAIKTEGDTTIIM